MKLKRFLLVVLSLTAMLCMAIGLTACGEKEHEHSPGSSYSSDASGHWLTCSECGEALEKTAHSGDPCTVCNYASVKTPNEDEPGNTGKPQNHVHNLTKHSATKPTCGEPGNSEYWACEGENGCEMYFSDSDGKKVIMPDSWVIAATGNHTPDGVIQTNEKYHWQKCTVCDNECYKSAHKSDSRDHNETQHWYVCSCGAVVGEKEEHRQGYTWGQDENQHWNACECGYQITSPENHTITETWENSTAEDLRPDNQGHKKRCSVCGVVTIPHTPDPESFEPYDESSNAFLYVRNHFFNCSECDYRAEESHRYDENNPQFEIDEENHNYICADCGVRAEYGHIYDVVMDSDTSHKKICRVCDYTMTEDHSFNDYMTDDTHHWQYCTTCGFEKSTKTAHTTSGWQSSGGYHYQYCKACQKVIARADHTQGTRHTDGIYHWYDCSVCNLKTESEMHTFVTDMDWTNTTCEICNYTLTESTGLSLSADRKTLLGIGTCTDTVIVIPNGVTTIAMNAFFKNETITGIILPDSVTTIAEGAFEQMSKLETVILGKGVTEIKQQAFHNSHIQNFYYKGTIAEFKRIRKGMNWFGSVIDFHCSDGNVNYNELDD